MPFGQPTTLRPAPPSRGGVNRDSKGRFSVTTSDRKLPHDVRRVASATTLKVGSGWDHMYINRMTIVPDKVRSVTIPCKAR